MEFILSLTNKVEAFWIGGKRDCHKCDTWHWNDGGEVINYTKWNSREPNNLGDREDCIEVRTDSAGWTPNRHWLDGTWNDRPCNDTTSNHNGFVCKTK